MNESTQATGNVSSERIVETLSPLVAGPKPEHLTEREWDDINWLYAELCGDLIRETVDFERRETPEPF